MAAFLRQLWQLLRPHQARLWLALLAGLIYGVSNGALILAVKLACDVLFPTEGAPQLPQELARLEAVSPTLHHWLAGWAESLGRSGRGQDMVFFAALVPAVMLFRGLGSYLSNYLTWRAATAAVHDLRVRLFSHLQGLSLDFFSAARTGELLSRISNDTQAFHYGIGPAFISLFREPLTIVIIVILLVWRQPQLTAVALVVFPLCLVPIIVYGRKVRRSWKAAQTHTAELSDVMQEAFTSQRIVQAYHLEATVIDRFAAASRRIASQFMRYIRANETPGPLIEFCGSIGVGLLFVYVARLAVKSSIRMSAGDFVSFVGSLFLLYQPTKNLGRLWNYLEQGRAAMGRLNELLATQSTIVDPAKPKPLHAAGADIEFDHVSFSYGEKPALVDFHLIVPAGQMVALVGLSGSGKTTVTNMLLRFYDPQQGAVRIGRVDLREAALMDVRGQMAVVTQETILFNDTIRENIRMGRQGATDAEIEVAARHANAHSFILAKPQGYDTVVGERGNALAGGERQRLAIARALLRNAPLLLLDEPTSALDAENERLVQGALDDLMQGRTTLCIAHRLSTVQRADLIVVMEAGQIVEQGRHAELLARRGVYAKLHALQFGTVGS